jgi:hypothetical protein
MARPLVARMAGRLSILESPQRREGVEGTAALFCAFNAFSTFLAACQVYS